MNNTVGNMKYYSMTTRFQEPVINNIEMQITSLQYLI